MCVCVCVCVCASRNSPCFSKSESRLGLYRIGSMCVHWLFVCALALCVCIGSMLAYIALALCWPILHWLYVCACVSRDFKKQGESRLVSCIVSGCVRVCVHVCVHVCMRVYVCVCV